MKSARPSPPSIDTDALVRVEGLTIELANARRPMPLVQDISFSIRPGECLGLVGESGSGKSLTSRALIGLNSPLLRQSARRFEVLGEDFAAASEARWQSIRGIEVGYVLQDALGAFDPLRSIFAEVGETLDAHRIGRASARRDKVVETLERVGFPDPELRAHQHSWQLSGGLRQRALIASAIVAAPRLLIADEPTTALDVNIQARIIALLEELKKTGMSLLFVSHDLAVVSTIADQVVVMSEGKVVEQGPTAQVLNNPGHDYTRQLIAAMPSRAPVGTRLSSVELPPSEAFRATRVRMDDGDAPALSVLGLNKSYGLPDGSRVAAVRDVDFELRRGEILGLVGGSGSGKSTIVKICMALVEPDEGEITLFGKPWTRLPEKERTARRPQIQLIAQDPLGAFDPRFTVRRLLVEALSIGGVPAREHEAEISRLLSAVGLRVDLIDRLPRNMSGGQRQRIAIARALATKPDVLVCDEPVSALDVSVQAQILDLLSHIHRETGLSILFISHDLAVVRHLCGRVMVMHKGEIVDEGTAEDIFTNVSHPYTRELIAAIPRMEGAAPAQVAQ